MNVIQEENILFVNIENDDPIIPAVCNLNRELKGRRDIANATKEFWEIMPKGYIFTITQFVTEFTLSEGCFSIIKL